MAHRAPRCKTLNRLGLDLPTEICELIVAYVAVATPRSFFPPPITAHWDLEHESTSLAHPSLTLLARPRGNDMMTQRREGRLKALRQLAKVDKRWKALCFALLEKGKHLGMGANESWNVRSWKRRSPRVLELSEVGLKWALKSLPRKPAYVNLVALSLDGYLSPVFPRVVRSLPRGPTQLQELRLDCTDESFLEHSPWLTLSTCTGLRVVEIESLYEPWGVETTCSPGDCKPSSIWYNERTWAEDRFDFMSEHCRGLPMFFALSKLTQLEDLTLADFYFADFMSPETNFGSTIYDDFPEVDPRTETEREEDPLGEVREFVGLHWAAPLKRLALYNVQGLRCHDTIRFARLFSSTLETFITDGFAFRPIDTLPSIFTPRLDPEHDNSELEMRTAPHTVFRKLQCVSATFNSSGPGPSSERGAHLVSGILEKAPMLRRLALKGYHLPAFASFMESRAGELEEMDIQLLPGGGGRGRVFKRRRQGGDPW